MGLGERRLAAIVVADVAGFSRMMAEDEDRTLSALRAHRNTTDPVILNHGGRIVKTTGDGMLIEFPSATSALDAAIEVQDLMRTRNAQLPESRRMQLRLGINLGDVVVDESGDVFGDGVNRRPWASSTGATKPGPTSSPCSERGPDSAAPSTAPGSATFATRTATTSLRGC